MPKEKKEEEQDEKLNQIMAELKKIENLPSEDVKAIESLLQKMISERKSKWKRFLRTLKVFLLDSLLLYIISILIFGFFINHMVISKFSIFYIGVGIAILFGALNLFLKFFGGKGFMYQVFSFICIIAITCLINMIYPVYDETYIWIIFYVSFALFYVLIIYYMIRRMRRVFYE